MNNLLIQNLMRESGFDPDSIERMGIMPNAVEFAKLIVQECLSCAQSHSSQMEYFAAGIDSVRDNIKEHFGLK